MDSLRDVLFALFRGTKHHDTWVTSCLEGAWPSLLGERIARICRPVNLRHGELTIEVRDSAWKEALFGMKDDLLRRLRSASGGEVTDLRVRIRDEAAWSAPPIPDKGGED